MKKRDDQGMGQQRPALKDGKADDWVTFDPRQDSTVTWSEDYWIYSSTTNVSGAEKDEDDND